MLIALLLAGLWDADAKPVSPSCVRAHELRANLAKSSDLPAIMRAGIEKKAKAAEAECNAAPAPVAANDRACSERLTGTACGTD